MQAAAAARDPGAALLASFDVPGQLTGRARVEQSAYLWTRLALEGYILRSLGDGLEMASGVEGRLAVPRSSRLHRGARPAGLAQDPPRGGEMDLPPGDAVDRLPLGRGRAREASRFSGLRWGRAPSRCSPTSSPARASPISRSSTSGSTRALVDRVPTLSRRGAQGARPGALLRSLGGHPPGAVSRWTGWWRRDDDCRQRARPLGGRALRRLARRSASGARRGGARRARCASSPSSSRSRQGCGCSISAAVSGP